MPLVIKEEEAFLRVSFADFSKEKWRTKVAAATFVFARVFLS